MEKMVNRRIVVALAAIGAMAAANIFVAGCVKSDDADTFSTPTPPPPPTPSPSTHCQIAITGQDPDGVLAAWVVDAPKSLWMVGTNSFTWSDGFTGMYIS